MGIVKGTPYLVKGRIILRGLQLIFFVIKGGLVYLKKKRKRDQTTQGLSLMLNSNLLNSTQVTNMQITKHLNYPNSIQHVRSKFSFLHLFQINHTNSNMKLQLIT